MQATLEGLAEEMARDPTIFVLGEGIGVRGGNFKTTAGLYDLYGPVRLRDTPICERGFVGLGCGAAMTGTRPVIDFMFADFVLDSVGEIINQIAKIQYMSSGRLKMPILLRGCIGIGHSAATHHSGNYYPMYAHFPGLRVVVPSTPHDAKGLLKRALRSSDPVIFLEHREILGVKGPVPDGDYEIEFGRAAVVREGSDVTVVALALMVHHTLKVCEQLASEGISVELIDPADGRTAGHRDDSPLGRQDRPTLDRRRDVRPVRHRCRDRRPACRRGLRRSRCADSPAQWRVHAHALQPHPGSRRRSHARNRSRRPSATSWPSEGASNHGERNHDSAAGLEHGRRDLHRLAQEPMASPWPRANPCSAWKATRRRRMSRASKREFCASHPTDRTMAKRSWWAR